MDTPFSFHQETRLHQKMRPMTTKRMQKALRILQLPTTDLTPFLETEIAHNPVLDFLEEPLSEGEGSFENEGDQEIEELDFSEENYSLITHLDEEYDLFFSQKELEPDNLLPHLSPDETLPSHETLYTFCLHQAFEEFGDDEEAFNTAEILLGYLDEKGLLTNSLQQIAKENSLPLPLLQETLLRIQQFDPPGIAAHSIQQCLLLQLSNQGKENSLGYKIIQNHYDLLKKNQIPKIQQALNIPLNTILDTIDNDIAPLDLHPGYAYSLAPTPPLIPDIIIEQDEFEHWHVSIPEEGKPRLRTRKEYIALASDPTHKNYLKNRISDATWILHAIKERARLLLQIGNFIVLHHAAYLTNPTAPLTPITQTDAAKALQIHSSTLSRAIANKSAETPRGALPLRHFFSTPHPSTSQEDFSTQTLKNSLLTLINSEDPHNPLPDTELTQKLNDQGLSCSRRTITKLRTQLHIGNTHQRKKYGHD